MSNARLTGEKVYDMIREAYEAGYEGSIELIDDEVERIFDKYIKTNEKRADAIKSPKNKDMQGYYASYIKDMEKERAGYMEDPEIVESPKKKDPMEDTFKAIDSEIIKHFAKMSNPGIPTTKK